MGKISLDRWYIRLAQFSVGLGKVNRGPASQLEPILGWNRTNRTECRADRLILLRGFGQRNSQSCAAFPVAKEALTLKCILECRCVDEITEILDGHFSRCTLLGSNLDLILLHADRPPHHLGGIVRVTEHNAFGNKCEISRCLQLLN